jgi:GMP synthase (glutamine-hydrolysing)
MKFLVFQHISYEHPGLITEFAKEHFIELDIVELWNLNTIPDPTHYKALIILNGPMAVDDTNDAFPSRDSELRYIKNNIGNLPMLGFGLGAQLLAHSLGSAVYPNVRDGKLVKEIGYYDVNLTETGQHAPLFKDFNPTFTALQWHEDTFDLPAGAELLASTETCTNQAFSYNQNIFGLQFHVALTPDMVAKKIEVDKNYINDNFVIDEKVLEKHSRDFAAKMKAQNYKLMINFLTMLG